MPKVAIIGAGISGISAARLLQGQAETVVFEQESKIGGLIKCDELPEGLYHKLGGHVFNTKSPAVSEWFWSHFDRDSEFHHLVREAKILLGSEFVGYPIENHLYQLPEEICVRVLQDLLEKGSPGEVSNFHDFLLTTFGATLCAQYFFPYNEKIFQGDLRKIPLGWLEGKLPMPKLSEILKANVLRLKETEMVHAKFFYPRHGGSQFVIDRLAEGLEVRLHSPIERMTRLEDGRWQLNDFSETFDRVVFSGDIRSLGTVAPAYGADADLAALCSLRTRGITNAFCQCDHTTTSWLYLPDPDLRANRIIYTGAFAPANNRQERMTCVVEFAYGEPPENIQRDLARLPGNLALVATNDVRDAYVIQETETRDQIARLSQRLRSDGMHLLGRFAEWEYYNADRCIESAMRVASEITGV